MTFIAVPNLSEGRDDLLIARFAEAAAEATVLDLHRDTDHNRTVLTMAGEESELVAGLTALASAALAIDLTAHDGIHPWVGALDVCPIVPLGEVSEATLRDAARVADGVGRRIGLEVGLPVYLYGSAAKREETRSLPLLRSGGLAALRERAARGLVPDYGPLEIDVRSGVVCVGARGPLIAFNVMLDTDVEIARRIAARVRSRSGGPHGIRALGLWLDSKNLAQVSMNLVEPERTGIDQAFDAVANEAEVRGVTIVGTELIGLPPARFMPDPKCEAARLLIEPGRSLEEAMNA
jgi:glutamate formiminotransferase